MKDEVTVYTNPYGDVGAVPQSTFRRADGFFIVYDPSKPDSIDCLSDYIQSVHEKAALGQDAPLVLLGVSSTP